MKAGESRIIVCHVLGGNPRPWVTWYRHGRPLNHATANRGRSNGTVTSAYQARQMRASGGVFVSQQVSATREEDGAVYECRVSSDLLPRPYTTNITLTVHCKSPPVLPFFFTVRHHQYYPFSLEGTTNITFFFHCKSPLVLSFFHCKSPPIVSFFTVSHHQHYPFFTVRQPQYYPFHCKALPIVPFFTVTHHQHHPSPYTVASSFAVLHPPVDSSTAPTHPPVSQPPALTHPTPKIHSRQRNY